MEYSHKLTFSKRLRIYVSKIFTQHEIISQMIMLNVQYNFQVSSKTLLWIDKYMQKEMIVFQVDKYPVKPVYIVSNMFYINKNITKVEKNSFW